MDPNKLIIGQHYYMIKTHRHYLVEYAGRSGKPFWSHQFKYLECIYSTNPYYYDNPINGKNFQTGVTVYTVVKYVFEKNEFIFEISDLY